MKSLTFLAFLVVGSSLSARVSAQCANWHALTTLGYAEAVTSVTRGPTPGQAYMGGWCGCSPHESAYTPQIHAFTNGVRSTIVDYPTWITGYVMDVGMFDLGAGPVLHAWGTMSAGSSPAPRYIARIVGGVPSTATVPIPGELQTVTVFDPGTGPAYHVSTASAVLRYTGSSWVNIGATIGTVTELVVHDDGSGPALYAGGTITSVAGVSATGVARWNGTSWSAVPGLSTSAPGTVTVTHLASLWTESGCVLVAGGSFESANGAPANGIASFEGTSWTGLGVGFPFPVTSVSGIESFDAGTGAGPRLVVSASGAGPLRTIASFEGAGWSVISGWPGGPVLGGQPIAVVNARGTSNQDLVTLNPVVWPWGWVSYDAYVLEACGSTGAIDCLGDGALVPCPCGNESASADRAGCLNSFGLAGALRARGVPELAHDTLVFDGTSMTNSSVLYFQGATFHAQIPFGDGLKCTGGPFVRLSTKTNVAGASSYPTAGDTSVSTRGLITLPGTRHYQARYRDVAAFCTVESFNYTNSVTIVWRP